MRGFALKCSKVNKSVENYLAFLEKEAEGNEGHFGTFSGYPEQTGNASADFLKKNIKSVPYYAPLIEEYRFDEIAGGGSAFEKTVNIMRWFTGNTFYCGMAFNLSRLTDNSYKVLKYCAGKGFKYALNCRQKAVALADILLALNITAAPVLLFGVSKKQIGCHLMTQVFLPELKKWAVFDPSLNTWFGEKENPLDIFELKKILAENRFPPINGYDLNGTDKCLEIYKAVFLRGCMQFIGTWENNARNACKRKKNIMFYLAEPLNENFYETIKNNLGRTVANSYPKYKSIGEKEFLSINEGETP